MNRLKKVLGKGIFWSSWKRIVVCALLGAGVYYCDKIYPLLNHGPYRVLFKTPLDDKIPLVPIFVRPYNTLETVIYATLIILILFQVRQYQSAALAMVITFGASFLFYIFLQSYMERPVLTGDATLIRMLRDVYAGDNPFNCFPSLHTSLSAIVGIHWWRFDKRIGWAALLWAAVVAASTVLVKQHYLADVVGGLALAYGASLLSRRIIFGGKSA